MNYADEIRRQAEAAPRAVLPAVAAALWKAFGDGHVSEAEAEALSALIDARQAKFPNVRNLVAKDGAQQLGETARRAVGSRPRTDASMERRRRWAASGRLPPALAARFTLAETAVLAVISTEIVKRGDCRMTLEHIAAVAGVSRSTVKATFRQARVLGLITVEERRQSAWRSLSNVVRIVSREWLAWMRLARRAQPGGGGVKSSTPTNTDQERTAIEARSRTVKGLPRKRGRLRFAVSGQAVADS